MVGINLAVNIKGQLHLHQGAALTNFERHLSTAHAKLATQALKDPYHFDFLGVGDEAHELDIENALMRDITRFLLELGAAFAFIGRQHRIAVGGDEFFIDLLFYHARLKCYVVVELKATAFKPEHAGQVNFYLAAVDSQLKARLPFARELEAELTERAVRLARIEEWTRGPIIMQADGDR